VIEKSGHPAYLQLADQLRAMIRSGELPDGAALPSTAQLVNQYEVSTSVVKAAISVLRTEGLVVGQQGKGVFAQASGGSPSAEHAAADDAIDQQLTEILETLRDLSGRMSRLEAEVFPTPSRTPSADS
jgi:DNA-binding GntR family transcriptional regulator